MEEDNHLREKCAVIGVFNSEGEAARLSFYGLWALQHRGQESSGIAASDGRTIRRHAGMGLVASVYDAPDIDNLTGNFAIGHNRYSTSGGMDDCHTQPFLDKKKNFALAHNGNLPDCTRLIRFLRQRGIETLPHSDTGLMQMAIGVYLDQGLDLAKAIRKAWPLFTGVFSAVALDKNALVAFRDKYGVRPLSIAKFGRNGYVVASETCAFDTIGAEFVRDVRPGEMVIIDKEGLRSVQIEQPDEKLDLFEFVYFARPDSIIAGQTIGEVRKEMGRQMAREFGIKADIVVPVPDSSIPMALGYAEESGIPFEMGLVKNRYIHRTFIRPTAELREHDLKLKLNAVPASLKGKRVILVDDSIVRGTTMVKLVKLVKSAGAKEVHLAISSPPVKFPDFYGINTPDIDELIATQMSIKQMTKHFGATSLNFLSLKGTVKATGLPAKNLNKSCFDGKYPVSLGVKEESLRPLPSQDIAIFASGAGSTAEAIIRAARHNEINGRVKLIITNNPDAAVLSRVRKLNEELGLEIQTYIINSKTYPPTGREKIERGGQTRAEQTAILDVLKKAKIDLVLLLGYMRKIGPEIVKEYGWRKSYRSPHQARMLNTHPGLLPDTAGMMGLGAQEFVVDSGASVAGQTLHVVSDLYDEGPIVAFHTLAVQENETAEDLFARVQVLEKASLPTDIKQFIIGRKKFLDSRREAEDDGKR
ncbi:amidophosphoribosyltransferase [Candidatus Saccharibacteria bacterium]|nr:amidophosphoribosyltransferase [Candidatus Saccharibacteria bacterium]